MKKITFMTLILCLTILAACSKKSTDAQSSSSGNDFLVQQFKIAESIYYQDLQTANNILENNGWKLAETEDNERTYKNDIVNEEVDIEINQKGYITDISFTFNNNKRSALSEKATYLNLVKYWGASYKLSTGNICNFTTYSNDVKEEDDVFGVGYDVFVNNFDTVWDNWKEWMVLYESTQYDMFGLDREQDETRIFFGE